MLNKKRRRFHSSRVKLPFANMSASWCLVSTYLIWVLGPSWFFQKNPSSATLWVRDTSLVVGLLPFMMIILITASLRSEVYHWASKRGVFAFVITWSALNISRSFRFGCFFVLVLVCFFLSLSRNKSPCSGVGVRKVCKTSRTKSQRSREYHPCGNQHPKK